MTKREQFGLTFSKVSDGQNNYIFLCTGKEAVVDSLELASLLRSVSDKEPDGLLEEVNWCCLLHLPCKCFVTLLIYNRTARCPGL